MKIDAIVESLKLEKEFEILCSLRSTKKLINSKILWSKNREVYRYSVFTEILVHLNFLLAEANLQLKKRISFTDDIDTNDTTDITHLINKFRNAACHVDSDLRSFGDKNHPSGQKSYFGDVHGKGFGFGELAESKYDDDVAFFVALEPLYLKRHIERVFKELFDLFVGCFPEHVVKSLLS